MPALKGSPSAPCDVLGCGRLAVLITDGTEKDTSVARTAEGKDEPLNRPATPKLFVCVHHTNWPHSDDAKIFSLSSTAYKARK